MYTNPKRLIILDADGTTIDAFSAITTSFKAHAMDIGDFERFQKRRHIFKYLGGIKEFPSNLKKQLGKESRKKILDTLTQVYREEAQLYPGIAALIQELIDTEDVVVGIITRNITHEPLTTLSQVFARHQLDLKALDFVVHVPLSDEKIGYFRSTRRDLDTNPARSYVCGDEYKDYLGAISCGIHPFMVSYGFEDRLRLTEKFAVPEDIISHSSTELCQRVRHALQLHKQDS